MEKKKKISNEEANKWGLTEIEILVGRKVEPEFELTVMPDVS
jgi:hypothetical protein